MSLSDDVKDIIIYYIGDDRLSYLIKNKKLIEKWDFANRIKKAKKLLENTFIRYNYCQKKKYDMYITNNSDIIITNEYGEPRKFCLDKQIIINYLIGIFIKYKCNISFFDIEKDNRRLVFNELKK